MSESLLAMNERGISIPPLFNFSMLGCSYVQWSVRAAAGHLINRIQGSWRPAREANPRHWDSNSCVHEHSPNEKKKEIVKVLIGIKNRFNQRQQTVIFIENICHRFVCALKVNCNTGENLCDIWPKFAAGFQPSLWFVAVFTSMCWKL